MARTPIPTWYFVLVVVRRGDRFLLIQERKHGQRWYLPAGRVEPGEDFIAAARRETLEEAGIEVAIEGVVRVEHVAVQQDHARLRVVFTATCQEGCDELGGPDSLDARWVTLEQLEALPLRGEEVRHLFEYLASGGTVFPLTVLGREGAPYQAPPS